MATVQVRNSYFGNGGGGNNNNNMRRSRGLDTIVSADDGTSVQSSDLDLSLDDSSIHTSKYATSVDSSESEGSNDDDDDTFDSGTMVDTIDESATLERRDVGSTQSLSACTQAEPPSYDSASRDSMDIDDYNSECLNADRYSRVRKMQSSQKERSKRVESTRDGIPSWSSTVTSSTTRSRSLSDDRMTRRSRTQHVQRILPSYQTRLAHVDYVSTVEVASTNRDISVVEPMGRAAARQAFQRDVPAVVAAKTGGEGGGGGVDRSDDVSSIGAVSYWWRKQTERFGLYNGEDGVIDEECGRGVSDDAKTVASPKSSSLASRTASTTIDSNLIELFFIGVISVSLVILIVLLSVILTKK